MRHFGSCDNPRSHPLVHHYTETKMHPMLQKDSALTSRVWRSTRVRLGKEAEQLRCPGKYSLACVSYECVKKIVARATHGEEIDMKAPFSRNKTMTPPPPCQTPVNTIKGRGGWDLVIVNTPTSMRAINELRLLHLTGHYTCPFWDSITHFELWTLTKQVMEPGPILSCEKKDPFKWTNIPQVSSLQWQHHWGGMWQGN